MHRPLSLLLAIVLMLAAYYLLNGCTVIGSVGNPILPVAPVAPVVGAGTGAGPQPLEEYPTEQEIIACRRAYGTQNMPGYFACRDKRP